MIVKLNALGRGRILSVLSRRKGGKAALLARRLRQALRADEIEAQDDENRATIEDLIADGKLRPDQQPSRKFCEAHGITWRAWTDPPEEIEVDGGDVELLRRFLQGELDKEESSILSGADWSVVEIVDELRRAEEESKAGSKSDGKKAAGAGDTTVPA